MKSFWNILNATLPLIHQLLLVILFVCSQYNVLFNDNETVSKSSIGTSSVTIILIVIYSLFTNFSKFLILSLLVYNLSPVIQTLTATVSDDTILTASIVFFMIHLCSFDYEYFGVDEKGTKSDKPLDCALSISCIFIPLILLGSRCSSPMQFFYLFLIIHFLFLGILPLRRFVYYHTHFHLLLQIGQWIIVLGLLGISAFTTLFNDAHSFAKILYIAFGDKTTILFATNLACLAVGSVVFCDLVYYLMHRYQKQQISGPWDEAIVVL
jgi:hypothetical protein